MLSRLLGSKTFWTGIAMVGFGIYRLITTKGAEGTAELGLGLTGIFVRDAIAKV